LQKHQFFATDKSDIIQVHGFHAYSLIEKETIDITKSGLVLEKQPASPQDGIPELLK
jgi:hypothetical protein